MVCCRLAFTYCGLGSRYLLFFVSSQPRWMISWKQALPIWKCRDFPEARACLEQERLVCV